MPAKYKIDPAKMATVLTSCGRFDLLEETVDTFLQFFDAQKIVIAEDAANPREAAAFASRVQSAEMRVNIPQLGQMQSIDRLYGSLTTPYVLHLEDDWRFTQTLDLDAVTDFLDARPDISVVCIAHRVYNPKYSHRATTIAHGGIRYLVWDLAAHSKWFSYSFNPSIARLALWREIGPFAQFITEENLSQFCKARGLRIAMVDPGIADHIGDDRHAYDPFQPPRAKTFTERLKRSVSKRWAKLISEFPYTKVGSSGDI